MGCDEACGVGIGAWVIVLDLGEVFLGLRRGVLGLRGWSFGIWFWDADVGQGDFAGWWVSFGGSVGCVGA